MDLFITRRGGSGGGGDGLPDFDYTGLVSAPSVEDGGWKLHFLTSGVLKFKQNVTIDVFCVGGGASGNTGGGSGYNGGGGGSGCTVTALNTFITANAEHEIIIGAGGKAATGFGKVGSAGGETSAFGLTASGGAAGKTYLYGGDGGSGGAGGYSGAGNGGSNGGNGGGHATYAGRGQGTTTREFGETTGKLYATGGASGRQSANIRSGGANTGDGGDGTYQPSSSNVPSGAGGSGVVIIRKAKGSA